ncbi:MAG TPA: hypothetical protein VIL12_01330 [Acidimicrobiia bacterium]
MLLASRLLFLVSGLLWLAIGALAPVMFESPLGKRTLFVSPSSDAALFGAPPAQLLVANPSLATFRRVMIPAIAGLLVASGLITAGVAWFGMMGGETWALTLLNAVGLVVIPFWWVVLGPYRAAGIALGLFDLPPFMWVPGLLMPAGAVLGWVSYVQGR